MKINLKRLVFGRTFPVSSLTPSRVSSETFEAYERIVKEIENRKKELEKEASIYYRRTNCKVQAGLSERDRYQLYSVARVLKKADLPQPLEDRRQVLLTKINDIYGRLQ